jgi:hypothetical protein
MDTVPHLEQIWSTVINTVKWGHPVCSRIVAVQPPGLVFSLAAAVVKTVAGVLVRPTGVLVMSAVWGVVSGRMGSALNPPACLRAPGSGQTAWDVDRA